MPPQPYDYGACDVCGSTMHEQTIKQDFWVRGELVVIDNVLAGVCPQCGAKVDTKGCRRSEGRPQNV